MNDLNKIPSEKFDSVVPVDDLCMAAGLVCTSQKRSLRHYELGDGRELTVNIARNEWAMKNPNCYGSASMLAEKLGLAEGGDCAPAFSLVEKLYADREKIPANFGYSAFSKSVREFTDRCQPKDPVLGRMMTRYGLSMDTIDHYLTEGWLPSIKGRKLERVLAMPVDNANESFMAFNGKMFRQIGDVGMSVIGERRKDQICMVYENPLDFLTMMESVTRNGIHPLMARRYHIILNGKRGLAEACEYLKANPDFLEVRSFMPENEFGRKAFVAINDAVKGTAIDRSEMYRGYDSLFAKHLPKNPETYLKWKAMRVGQDNNAIDEKESHVVGQERHRPKLDISPLLGGERKTVIDRETGGLKL